MFLWPWYVYALLAAAFFSLCGLLEKKILVNVHSLDYTSAKAIYNALFSLPFLFFADFSQLNWEVFFLVIVASSLSLPIYFLTTKGTKHLDISVAAPLQNLAPLMTALVAFLFLQEGISWLQLGGMFLVVLGTIYLENNAGRAEDNKQKYNKYFWYLILAALLSAIGYTFDRYFMSKRGLDPLAYISIIPIIACLELLLIAYLRGFQNTFSSLRQVGWRGALVSLFTVLSRLSNAQAIKEAVASLVATITRSASLITAGLGGQLFHEKNLWHRLLAAVVIIFGAIIITLA